MSASELPIVTLSKEQKEFAKHKLLEITAILKRWQERYNETFEPEKPIAISEIKKVILDGSLEERFPEIICDKRKLQSFAKDHIEFLGGPAEFVIICSFAAACKSAAKKRSKKISAELNLSVRSVFEDLIQDAYASVQHSIYYFTREDLELSTFVIGSLLKSLERCSRYKYSKFSPMSPDDAHKSYKCRVIMMENPNLTVEEIAEEMSIDYHEANELLCSMSQVVRVFNDKDNQNSENHTSGQTTLDLISQIPDKRISAVEESDSIDAVEYLKSIFDDTDSQLLSLTREEKDVLIAAVSSNFERGWQSRFSRVYIGSSTGRTYTRARIGQIYASALDKVRCALGDLL